MRTVLVVDDNESVLTVLAFFLTRSGCTVLTAKNGEAALDLVAQHTIDCAIVDLHMPGMNGVDLCREIIRRAEMTARAVPVWLITGGWSSEAARLACEAGAKELLRKPFSTDELQAKLEDEIQRLAQVSLGPPGISSPAAATADALNCG